jgi:phage gpG-like protein
MDNKQVMQQMKARLEKVIKGLPRIIANEALNFTKDNFKKQGFQGAVFERWPARNPISKWGATKRNKGRAILVDTGRLRRANRISRSDWAMIVISNDTPYAKAHNEGVSIKAVKQSVKAHTRKIGGIKKVGGLQSVRAHSRTIRMKIPRRRFIGSSPYLVARMKRIAGLQLMKAVRNT